MEALLGFAVLLFFLWILGQFLEVLEGFLQLIIELMGWYEKDRTSCLVVLTLTATCTASYLIGSLLTGESSESNPIVIGGAVVVPIVLVIGVLVAVRNRKSKRKRLEEAEQRIRLLKLSDVDSMNGVEFEHSIGKLMKHQGFQIQVTPGSGDFGVDLIAVRDSERWAVQCKRRKSTVSLKAVQEVVAGRDHHYCNATMVVTNSHFTQSAIELAQSTGCRLVDRNTLADCDWIVDFKHAREEDHHGE